METAQEESSKDSIENVLPANNTNEKPPPQERVRKSNKEDRVKKDDKSVEQFMKSLNNVPTLEEKLSLVCKKYVQTADDNKKLQFYIKQSDKRYTLLSKERDQLQHEYNKTILIKSKLENLCRELQKQNKAIKEESLLKIREEEERRKETQAKFQSTLTDITALLQQNNDKNTKLRDDNISMTEKFNSVVMQYQLREQQVDKMAKQMALESQLSDAKLQKAQLEHKAERERMLAEFEQIKMTSTQYRAKILELQSQETALKSQLAIYTDKYDEFQTALTKSNQLFGGFKEQMDKMSKKIKKLEAESLSWKSRWESSQSALLDTCAQRQAGDERAARQLQHMQGLCRTLQSERAVLLSTLKEHNIERPPLPAPAPAPLPPPPPANSNVEAMEANCAQLRQSLVHLQSQLDTLTNKKEETAKSESPKPDKPKKSKSKKKSKSADKNNVQNEEPAKDSKDKLETNEESKIDETRAVNNVEESNTDENKTLNNVEAKESIETPKLEEKKTENGIAIDNKGDKKVDDLLQTINVANINLCDLEVVDAKNEESVLCDGVLKEKIAPVEANEVEQVGISDRSLVLDHPNEELAHIDEVKPISNEA